MKAMFFSRRFLRYFLNDSLKPKKEGPPLDSCILAKRGGVEANVTFKKRLCKINFKFDQQFFSFQYVEGIFKLIQLLTDGRRAEKDPKTLFATSSSYGKKLPRYV